MLKSKVRLNNGNYMPNIMLGSFQVENQNIMTDMVRTAIEEKVYGFDTSPSYGTEKMLGDAIAQTLKEKNLKRETLFIADKVDGWQMCKNNGNIAECVNDSLKKMNLEYFDMLLVHWPFDKYLKQTWTCMEQLLKEGIIKNIGLSNVNIRKYKEFLEINPEIEPQVIQNEIHPLNSCQEYITFFQKRNIVMEAYSPLCKMISDIRHSKILKDMEEKYNKTIPQILLRWNWERNIVPIFTSIKPQRIRENVDIEDFSIDEEDVKRIVAMNINYKIFPESYGCPGY